MKNSSKHNAANVVASVFNSGRRLPENIFTSEWTAFFFFDPDLIFEAKFIDVLKLLLDADSGDCICMCRLSEDNFFKLSDAALFFDKSTSGFSYFNQLKGDGNGVGWLYEMNNHGCASDSGSWCIYCERCNEVALIAFKGSGTSYTRAIEEMGGLPVALAIKNSLSHGLLLRSESSEWCDSLMRSYKNI